MGIRRSYHSVRRRVYVGIARRRYSGRTRASRNRIGQRQMFQWINWLHNPKRGIGRKYPRRGNPYIFRP